MELRLLVYLREPSVERIRRLLALSMGGSNKLESTVGRLDELAILGARPGRPPSVCLQLQPATAGRALPRTPRFIVKDTIAPMETASA
jgi:hypothetical protein